MWATLALTAMVNLAPAQGSLQTKNVQVRYGILGQVRKNTKFLPGDILSLTFDVSGFKVADNGKVEYSIGFEVSKKGAKKPEVKREPEDLEASAHLGGTSLTLYAFWPIKADTPPGDYTMKLNIKDRKGGATATLSKSFEVIKKK